MTNQISGNLVKHSTSQVSPDSISHAVISQVSFGTLDWFHRCEHFSILFSSNIKSVKDINANQNLLILPTTIARCVLFGRPLKQKNIITLFLVTKLLGNIDVRFLQHTVTRTVDFNVSVCVCVRTEYIFHFYCNIYSNERRQQSSERWVTTLVG